jgi:hypothetical protein
MAIQPKAAEGMRIELNERPAQRHRLLAPAVGLAEGAVPARISQEREGLIVEVEIRLDGRAVKIDDGYDSAVGGDEMSPNVFKGVARRFAPGAIPAEPAGLAISERLAGEDTRSMRLRQWSAIEVDRLVEATARAVGAVLPPAWQGQIEQPVFERGRFASEIAHISDLVRFGEALSTGRHATIIAAGFFS